jgi:hypothetical protein
MEPKRIFHAVVLCGISLTACGGTTGEQDSGSPSDGGTTSDAKEPSDASFDAKLGNPDANDGAVMDVKDFDVIPPPPPIK